MKINPTGGIVHLIPISLRSRQKSLGPQHMPHLRAFQLYQNILPFRPIPGPTRAKRQRCKQSAAVMVMVMMMVFVVMIRMVMMVNMLFAVIVSVERFDIVGMRSHLISIRKS